MNSLFINILLFFLILGIISHVISCDTSIGPLFGPSPCPENVTLNTRIINIYEGRTAQISIKESVGSNCHVVWESSNLSVVGMTEETNKRVDLIARQSGEAVITVSVGYTNPLKANCRVIVHPVSIDSISIEPDSLIVPNYLHLQAKAHLYDSTGTEIIRSNLVWSSSDPSIITVSNFNNNYDNSIFVKGEKLGSAILSLSYEGLTASIPVKVFPRILYDIWGSSENNIYFVGLYGTILHYDESGWHDMTIDITENLNSIWGSSSSDIYAVGGRRYIFHYDGLSWNQLRGMQSGFGIHHRSVWGSSEDDVYVVGVFEPIQHFDGTQWDTIQAPTPRSVGLWDIWGSSDSDVFAVGDSGSIIHYDGNQWNNMSSNVNSTLFGVWGSSPTNVFAVGGFDKVILHYDGESWSSAPIEREGRLTDIWGSSESDVYAVGLKGTILHFDGNVWSHVSTEFDANFWSIWGSSKDNIYVAGYKDKVGIIIRFDGIDWKLIQSYE